jgi:uncharacterized protein DUF2330
MARRLLALSALVLGALGLLAGPALACGGLVAPGHAEVLQKAVTLSAWHNGLEHYVTGFQFAGSANSFGYIIPLPGNPSKIQKAGDWTLERLEREVNPIRFEAFDGLTAFAAPRAAGVTVLQRKTVDALDIVVVKGGGADVAKWAKENGFDLTLDTPKVLADYSDRGAVFALARFDNKAAVKKGLAEGQGTIIHFTIPTQAPWIPLKILALGKSLTEIVDADLFVLTDHVPNLQPAVIPGMEIRHSGVASPQLLADLRADRGMRWLPTSGMWFMAMTIHTPAVNMRADLSIDGGGLPASVPASSGRASWAWLWWIATAGLMTVAVVAANVVGPTPRPA